jgi:hypothetical protein
MHSLLIYKIFISSTNFIIINDEINDEDLCIFFSTNIESTCYAKPLNLKKIFISSTNFIQRVAFFLQ